MATNLETICTWAYTRVQARNLTRDQLIEIGALLQVVAHEARQVGESVKPFLNGRAAQAEAQMDELTAQVRWLRDESERASTGSLYTHIDRALEAAGSLIETYTAVHP